MAITAAQVKELREMTGSGMMDCKKALTATDGNIEKAIEWLREKGLATAQKKASRIAAEGISMAVISEDEKKAVVVEVNSETDFVAQNEKFRNYVKQVADQALDTTAKTLEEFMAQPSKADPSKTVEEANAAQIAVIGENLKIRRFQQISEDDGVLVAYTHQNGKIVFFVNVVINKSSVFGIGRKILAGNRFRILYEFIVQKEVFRGNDLFVRPAIGGFIVVCYRTRRIDPEIIKPLKT